MWAWWHALLQGFLGMKLQAERARNNMMASLKRINAGQTAAAPQTKGNP